MGSYPALLASKGITSNGLAVCGTDVRGSPQKGQVCQAWRTQLTYPATRTRTRPVSAKSAGSQGDPGRQHDHRPADAPGGREPQLIGDQ